MNDELWCLLRSSFLSSNISPNQSSLPPFYKLTKPLNAYLISAGGITDLLNSENVSANPIQFLEHKLEKKLKCLKGAETIEIISLFYEYGNYLLGLPVEASTPLAIYLSFSPKDLLDWQPKHEPYLKAKSIRKPDWRKYQEKFEKIQIELHRGNSYQANLTDVYRLEIDKNCPERLANKLFNRPLEQLGQFAHAINLPKLQKMLISNSPESLFEIVVDKSIFTLSSKPIKGTVAIKNGNREEAEVNLINSGKDQAELFMIADLIRNDLSRISSSRAHIKQRKAVFSVPGLVHQFSEIVVDLDEEVSLDQILRSLFPGGSITGAPKKSTTKILYETEGKSRGFYCGSTVVISPNGLKASINIRAGEYNPDLGLFYAHAGGGITVKSQCQKEFQEMSDKFESFAKDLLST
jgi:para-aminobenzoate synthetase component 1